mmetsp:Transcript_60326/g.142138  ORF Transcript_60326/g.142138 Transcript_60326/m.142138 type:complete len:289 (-) Transcript_60326:125-991(-)
MVAVLAVDCILPLSSAAPEDMPCGGAICPRLIEEFACPGRVYGCGVQVALAPLSSALCMKNGLGLAWLAKPSVSIAADGIAYGARLDEPWPSVGLPCALSGSGESSFEHTGHWLFLRSCRQIEVPLQSLQTFLRRLCSQIEVPPHCLQCRRRRLCSQIEVPAQSLHSFFLRLCAQIEAPLHCLHLRFNILCSQIDDPPHSLHSRRLRRCSQMEAPLQSLHSFLRLLCSQMDEPLHALHSFFLRLCTHSEVTLGVGGLAGALTTQMEPALMIRSCLGGERMRVTILENW